MSTRFGSALVAALAILPVIPAAFLIVPGQRVGPVVLGMRVVQVFQHLGPPAGRAGSEGGGKFFWPQRGITVRVDSAGHVDTIFVEHPRYRTAQGIGVGSGLEEVLRAFGPTHQAQEDRSTLVLAYPGLGISFALDKSRGERVQMVVVYRPMRP
ncbi:MAG: hypothetical protein QN193_03700 [Armatimonadota bacterium]|nr:hypothetical protein [Armatimonadota bacterium]MDR7444318.1 hypothetical protein [Armatimonadota bacterium]MDR7569691.1 hypothetical protein [Armatimonadota bacterium]MDR7614805.1 hypothetical protein [Armatimonadota bacterium]